MSNGLIIIYIGDGKGKTTAAVGLAVRAAGAGYKVLFTQFVKSGKATESGEWPESSEISVMRNIPNITVEVLGKGFVGILGDQKTHEEHASAAREGLLGLKKEIESGKYGIVIADELVTALELGLLTETDILEIIEPARKNLAALVLTGHEKYNDLINAADLVTEMKMIKHPYYQGIKAKKGIDY